MKGLVHFLLLLVCAQHATDLVADVLSYLLHPLGAVDDEASFVCAGKMVPLLYLCLMYTLLYNLPPLGHTAGTSSHPGIAPTRGRGVILFRRSRSPSKGPHPASS